MAAESNIALTVVVSGAPQHITINVHEKVAQLMRKALHQAGIDNSDLAGWNLRFAAGGDPIAPEARIGEAGIGAGATLFLSRDEGGGGEIAVPGPDIDPPPVLVDPTISTAKLARELEQWSENSATYQERGWLLLDHDELHVEVAFSVPLPVGPFQDLVSIPLAVRFGFENYDVWPPSVRLIDPISRRWLQVPRVAALDFTRTGEAGAPANLFIVAHPETGHVFFCKPGVREYHSHPEHSGDDWLLYRGEGFGTLAQLCDSLWRLAVRNVTGLNFISQRLAMGQLNSLNHAIELRQENVDQLTAEAQAQMSQVMGHVPPVVQNQLPPEIQAQIENALREQGP
ncbi:MAG: putative metal-binding protein [Solirubrobacterales bacterium]